MDILEVFGEEHTELLKKAGYNTIEDLYSVSVNQISRIPWMRHSSATSIVWNVTKIMIAGDMNQVIFSFDEIKDDLLGEITPQMIAEKMKEIEE